MRSLCVAVDRLAYPFAEHVRAKQNLRTATRCLQNVQYGLYGISYQLSMKASGLMNEALRLTNTVDALNRYVAQSAREYHALELRLTKTAGLINGKKQPSANDINDLSHRVGDALQYWKEHFASLKPSQTGKAETANQTDWSLDFFDGYVDTASKGFSSGSIVSLLYQGVKYQVEGAFHIAKVSATKRFNENHYISAEAAVGNAEASGSVKGVLFDNKGFHPSLKAEGEVMVSAVQAKAVSVLKNDFIKNTFKARVDVGVASASGKAVISKDEVTIKGEAGVALARASTESTYELWGWKFTFSGSTEVGLGAGTGFSTTSNSFEVGASLSLLLGLGGNLKIEW